MYFLATGLQPSSDLSSETTSQKAINKAAAQRLSKPLEQIISKCLRLNKTEKYSNICELEKDLQFAVKGKEIPSNKKNGKSTRHYVTVFILCIIIVASLHSVITELAKWHSLSSMEPENLTPTVRSETPIGSGFDTSSGKIVLRFSHSMDTESIQESLQINNLCPKVINWSENDTLCEIPINNANVFMSSHLVLTIDTRIAQDKKSHSLGRYYQNGFELCGFLLKINYGK
jgi:hypothetical protein